MIAKKSRPPKRPKKGVSRPLGQNVSRYKRLTEINSRLMLLEVLAKKGRTKGERISAIYEIGKTSVKELHSFSLKILNDIVTSERDPEVLHYVAKAVVQMNYGKGVNLLLRLTKEHPKERNLRVAAIKGIGSLAGAMNAEQLKYTYSELQNVKKSCAPGSVVWANIDKTLKILESRMGNKV